MEPTNNITQETLELIERYINHKLTDLELSAFEDKLKNNPDFKNQVDDIKIMLLGIEKQTLKEQLDEFHETIPNKTNSKTEDKKTRFFDFRKIAVAAAVILALGSIWFFNDSSAEKIYAKHYTPDPGLPTTMSSSDNFEFYDAMVNYKREDYKTAISKWEMLLKNKPENDTLNYFLGSAYLAEGQEQEAIPFLKKVIQLNEITFKNDAYYYLGLAYLNTEDLELAKTNLNLSTVPNSKDILSELED